MNNKFYVSYEAARLLKEKGYNEKVEKAYATMNDGKAIKVLQVVHNNKELPELCYSCPTKAEAIDWLESKGLIIVTELYFSRGKWSARIQRKDSWAYVALGEYYLTRLQAEEAAIIKACELL